MNQPPFETATLARLYLAQGHHDTARRMARSIGGDSAAAIEQELEAVAAQQADLLESLLSRVQERRRSGTTHLG